MNANASPGKVVVPIFSGPGTTDTVSDAWLKQSLSDSLSPSGSLLLQSCYRSFLEELASLSSEDFSLLGLSLDEFPVPTSLLTHERNTNHILLSHSFLFLSQALRWLSVYDYSQPGPFAQPFDAAVGCLSFSLGVLMTPVVASSTTLLDYLCSAVEAYKVTLWIGIRVHLHHHINPPRIALRDSSWSVVCVGISPTAVQKLITDFHIANQDYPHIYLTSTLSPSAVTISGPPHVLAEFSTSFPDAFSVLPAHAYGIYHVDSVHKGTRNQVLCDIRDRGIKFPTRAALKVPIISTSTGDSATTSAPLVEEIVDMILTQAADWDRVVSSTVGKLKTLQQTVEVLNVGPGNSLARGLERQISAAGLDVRIRDISFSQHTPPAMEPIAVVGMAVDMPGAPNVDRLWELLQKGESTLSQIPEMRFDITSIPAYLDSPTISQMGNFLANPAAFDHKFFNISPRAAEAMDPQQRVLLHVAHEALENAGYVPDSTCSWKREGFGCFIGAATGEWADCLREQADLYHSTGTLRAFLSGRISHFMKWGGPSVVVDTACSSSIVAIYQACRALKNGDCNAALAGGVNIMCSPDNFAGLSKGRFLSPTGQCKPFDASADGYARSEGCGLFVLKLLSSAVEENDRILGVIRGVEVNQNNRNTSITRPDVDSQRSLFERLCLRSGTDPQHVSVIEAHGTGTQVGDKCEIESVSLVFGSAGRPSSIHQREVNSTPRFLHVGSVKANIGHLEAASGAAGLAKLLLMLRYRRIPRLICLDVLNSELGCEEDLAEMGVAFDRESVDWDTTGKRIAVLNNFGAAGSNGALILEEYTPEDPPGASNQSPVTPAPSHPVVFSFSAKTPEAAKELQWSYLNYLHSVSGPIAPSLRDLAYTSTARRQLYPHRISVTADSLGPLISSLESAVPNQVVSVKKVAFVFSGQGIQYLGMGGQLYWTNEVFRRHVHECQRILEGFGCGTMIKWISGGSSVSGLSSTRTSRTQEEIFPDAGSSDGVETLLEYQTAVFTVGYALANLWISWGVEPSIVIGHSLGEYPALVIAGVISVESALHLLLHRANITREKCPVGTSGMYAVRLMDPKKLFGCMEGLDISVACYQTSTDFVLAGKTGDLRILQEKLYAIGEVKHQLVDLPLGFHSAYVDPALQDFAKVARGISVRPPTIPVVSTVLDTLVHPGTPDVFTTDYFVQHFRMPVLFVQATSRLIEEFGAPDLWLELGPTTLFLSSIAALPQLSRAGTIKPMLLPSLKRTESPWFTLSSTLAKLYLTDLPIRWREIFTHRQMRLPRLVDLPSYPFQTTDFWTPYQSNRSDRIHNSFDHSTAFLDGCSLFQRQTQIPTWINGRVAVFETPVTALAKFIEGHMVAGNALCPASVYTELGLAASRSSSLSCGIFVLSELEFTKPFVYLHGSHQILVTVATTVDDGLGTFNVCSRSAGDGEGELHCRGMYLIETTDEAILSALTGAYEDAVPRISSLTSTSRDGVQGREKEVFSKRTVYDLLFPRVVVYSKDYQAIQSFTVSSDSTEGYATFRLPFDRDRRSFTAHPIFVDSVLQVAGFLANMRGGVRDVHICDGVDTIRILVEAVDDDAEYGAYCKSVGFAEGGVDIVACEVIVIKLGGEVGEVPEVVVQAKGIRFKKLQLDSLVRRLNPIPVAPVRAENAPKASLSPPRPPIRRAKAASFSIPDLPPLLHKIPVSHTPEVIEIIATTCGVDPTTITPGSDLRSLGVDSLLLMEIAHRLQKLPAITFRYSSSVLALCHTVADIISLIGSRPGSPVIPRKRASSTVSLLAINEEENVHHLLANALGVERNKLGMTDDLGSHGLDSLSAAEVLRALKEEFNVSLPQDFFERYRTVAQVQAQIWQYSPPRASRTPYPPARSHSNSFSSLPSLVSVGSIVSVDSCVLVRDTYQPTDACATPLFMIHDGSGLINSYAQVGDIGRVFYGIKDPYFGTGESWTDVSNMAREYARLISDQSDGGPVILGGWSFGGVAAFEIGRLMIKEGSDVRGVVLVDAPCPMDHVPLSAALLDNVLNQGSTSRSEAEAMRSIKEQFRKCSELLEGYSPSPDGPYPRAAFLRSREGVKVESESMREKLPVWLVDREEPETTTSGWETVLKNKVERWDVPGDHFQPFLPRNIERTTQCIAEACRYLDSHGEGPI